MVAGLSSESVWEATVGAAESEDVVREESEVVRAVVVSVGSVMVMIGVAIASEV